MRDGCGVCSGGTTGLRVNALMDCSGECRGSAVLDACGICTVPSIQTTISIHLPTIKWKYSPCLMMYSHFASIRRLTIRMTEKLQSYSEYSL